MNDHYVLTASFAPRCVVKQIVENTSFDEVKGRVFFDVDAAAKQVEGAVLMADASGFTALTEKLSSKENGAEMLCSIINRFFSVLIDIVLNYGGDVIQFAGDAVLVVFEVGTDVDEGHAATMCEAVRRAVQASADIHAALNEYPAWADVTLALHVGVGCGQLTTMHVGGVFDRQEFVVAGEPMRYVDMHSRQCPLLDIPRKYMWGGEGGAETCTFPAEQFRYSHCPSSTCNTHTGKSQ